MEIVVFVMLMVVPFISIAALILALVSFKGLKATRSLVVQLVQISRGGNVSPIDEALDAYKLGGV